MGEGNHCSRRPKYILDSAVIFLSERLFVGDARHVPKPQDLAAASMSGWSGNMSSFAAQTWMPLGEEPFDAALEVCFVVCLRLTMPAHARACVCACVTSSKTIVAVVGRS